VTSSPFTKRTRPAGLVLTPGASADRDHHTLVAIDEALVDLPVLRLTLGTNRVPSAVKKMVAASEVFADELGVPLDRLAYGGRSFGGRSCSVAVAEGLPAAALALLSYPLHPPGKPDNLRVEHFPEINVPALFVSGRRDPFGTPEEFERHMPAIPGPTTVEWVDGNHAPKDDTPVIEHVREFLGY
jgi:predicted alpha/beta-hydrolase family hydrolase